MKEYKNAELADFDSGNYTGSGGHHGDETFRWIYPTSTICAAGGLLFLLTCSTHSGIEADRCKCCLCHLGWRGDRAGSDSGCDVVSRAGVPVEGGFNPVDCGGSSGAPSQ